MRSLNRLLILLAAVDARSAQSEYLILADGVSGHPERPSAVQASRGVAMSVNSIWPR